MFINFSRHSNNISKISRDFIDKKLSKSSNETRLFGSFVQLIVETNSKWIVKVSKYSNHLQAVDIYRRFSIRSYVSLRLSSHLVSIGSFLCFLHWFCFTGVYSDYTSSFYLRHCFNAKKSIDVYDKIPLFSNYLWCR